MRLREERAVETGNTVRLDLVHEKLAQIAGTTPFTIGRLLSAWQERGFFKSNARPSRFTIGAG